MQPLLKFRIEEKKLNELINDAEMYKHIREMGRSLIDSTSGSEIKYDEDIVNIAEMNTNIAILYSYYKNDLLNDAFKLFKLYGNRQQKDSSVYVISWGKVEKMNKTMSKICKILSELSVDNIASTQSKTDLYHNITELIDSIRRRNRPHGFLDNPEFWELYFRLHDEYFSK